MTIDPSELRRIVKRTAATLSLYARQWCADPDDAVQEAYLDLAESNAAPDSIDGWLFQTVKRRAIDQARAADRRERHESNAARQAGVWFERDGRSTDSIDPAEATLALERLPEEEREAVVARLWGELTFEQIALLAGVSTATAHRRYLSGIENLRRRLSPGQTSHHDRPSRMPRQEFDGAETNMDKIDEPFDRSKRIIRIARTA
jgi:RNA polymerase sigma-70 factor (ECF subfamily)